MLDTESFLLGIAAGDGGGGGGGVTVEPLTVTENGEYTAPPGKAYSPVTVAVPGQETGYFRSTFLAGMQLQQTNLSFPEGSEITIDASNLNNFDKICYGSGNCPGYEQVTITPPLNSVGTINGFSDHKASDYRGFKRLVLTRNLIIGAGNNAFSGNRTLVSISGADLDFTNAFNLAAFTNSNTLSLESFSVVPSSIKVSLSMLSPALDQTTLVSLANGLDDSVSGHTLALNSTIKAGLTDIVGTVTDGIFAADPAGTITLMDFISTVKGWTLA